MSKMPHELQPDVPILRVFQARAKPGCEAWKRVA
jgi:hypothetical protein